MTGLVTIRTNGGVPFTVAADHADKFTGLLNDLEAAGVNINAGKSGGYNYRTIAGTDKLSNHAHGAAVDVNWDQNARGTAGAIDPALARQLATKWGMTWGGDWKNPDPMHFEVGGTIQPLVRGGPPPATPAAPSAAAQPPPSGGFGGLAFTPQVGGVAPPEGEQAAPPPPSDFGSLQSKLAELAKAAEPPASQASLADRIAAYRAQQEQQEQGADAGLPAKKAALARALAPAFGRLSLGIRT